MRELWKDIPGWEGRYQVSNLGRVKSLYREVTIVCTSRWGSNMTCTRRYAEKVLRPNIDSGGYAQVVLQDKTEQRRETVAVHRLVLAAWRGPSELHAMHLNDQRADNRLSNLRWGTRQENAADMAAKKRRRGGGQGRYLSEADYLYIQSRPTALLKDLAKAVGTSKSNVSKIRAKALK